MSIRAGAFTLIEVLMVLAVIVLLAGILLPAMAGARSRARAVGCLSNLRQIGVICAAYADENRGISPAIGQPYTDVPAWPIVIQRGAGSDAVVATDVYSVRSVLVCPAISSVYVAEPMVRTYAMNATGHAGLPADPDNYDSATRPGFIHLDRVLLPWRAVLFLDSDVPPPTTTNPPPPTRTAAMIDFRQPEQVATRVGRFHGARGGRAAANTPGGFNRLMVDLSAGAAEAILDSWREPLP